jgi:AAA15 family ATPase/GTPase
MENFIKQVNIHNFKSIADLKLEDCKRINLFIGYPNVGKSNVLEAFPAGASL